VKFVQMPFTLMHLAQLGAQLSLIFWLLLLVSAVIKHTEFLHHHYSTQIAEWSMAMTCLSACDVCVFVCPPSYLQNDMTDLR